MKLCFGRSVQEIQKGTLNQSRYGEEKEKRTGKNEIQQSETFRENDPQLL
jgi:hypothetical protein